jgi:hypothetical protein
MICPHCATGADLTVDPAPQISAVRKLAVDLHGQCKGGTWCDCHHRVVSLEELAKRREAMPRGGLARAIRLLSA